MNIEQSERLFQEAVAKRNAKAIATLEILLEVFGLFEDRLTAAPERRPRLWHDWISDMRWFTESIEDRRLLNALASEPSRLREIVPQFRESDLAEQMTRMAERLMHSILVAGEHGKATLELAAGERDV